ncbi:hypothetical protein HHI36_009360 [Cryptolaemus montrouzieri]|uniref:BED-type domain-containing protein n=1 Tax=Cryptolaemus montrouzieri TaxID=559131 RepID=A0ABD2MV70_9CUCU
MSTQRSQRSKVREFYTVDKFNRNVICNNCKTSVSRGDTGQSASATPLLDHLRRHHQEQYAVHLVEEKKNVSHQPTLLELQERSIEDVISRKPSPNPWKCLEDIKSASGSDNTGMNEDSALLTSVSQEIEAYVKIALLDEKGNSLTWWSNHKVVFPTLSRLGKNT